MARKQRDIVNYFPHDAYASAKSDTVIVLQSKYGNDGYAFWFKLLENLATTDGHYIDLRNPARLQVFMAKMGIDKLLGVEMLGLLVEMEAIDKELWKSKVIWCQNLVDNVADVYKNRRREIPLKPIITSRNQITTTQKAILSPNPPVVIPQIKLNDTKLNDTNNNSDEADIFGLYEREIGELTPSIEEELRAAMSKFPLEWIRVRSRRRRGRGINNEICAISPAS